MTSPETFAPTSKHNKEHEESPQSRLTSGVEIPTESGIAGTGCTFEDIKYAEDALTKKIVANQPITEIDIAIQTNALHALLAEARSGILDRQLTLAEEIMGSENILSYLDAARTFSKNLNSHQYYDFLPENIPPIPFSVQDLQEARDRGEKLIFFIDHYGGNRQEILLAPGEMSRLVNYKMSNDIRCSVDWVFSKRARYVPRFGWRLVSTQPIPETVGKKYIDQLAVAVDYLRTTVFKGAEIPEPYASAIQEFEEKRALCDGLPWVDDEGNLMTKLKINRLILPSESEEVYRLILTDAKTQERLLTDVWSLTHTSAYHGQVIVGQSTDNGVASDYVGELNNKWSMKNNGMYLSRGI